MDKKQPSKSILRDTTLLLSNKRRVSFAPEVTLHKFDFVPSRGADKRRRTIGEVPLLQESEEGSIETALTPDGRDIYPAADVPPEDGIEMLQDSSDLEDEANQFSRGVGDLLKVGLVEDEPSMEFTGSVNGFSVEKNHFEEDVEDFGLPGDDEEQTMELTGTLPNAFKAPQLLIQIRDSPIKAAENMRNRENGSPERNLETEMQKDELNVPVISSFDSDLPVTSQADGSDHEVDMELTETIKVTEKQEDDEMTMELTSVITTKLDEGDLKVESAKEDTEQTKVESPESNIMPPPASNRSLDVAPVNEDANDTEYTMELTQPISRISHDAQPEDEEQTMDITMQVPSKVDLENKENKPPGKGYDHEETSSTSETNPTIESNRVVEITENTEHPSELNGGTTEELDLPGDVPGFIDDETHPMELTQVHSEINNLDHGSQPMELTQEEAPLREEYAVTSPKNKTESTTPSEATKSESTDRTTSNDIEEPSNSKDDKDVHDELEANISTNSIQEVISTLKIPLAEITIDETLYENYTPVKLDDFMNDIGVKFYDDLDIDIHTIRSSITNEHLDFKPEDYMRALPKLELLALYQFSCEELHKNIEQGRKVFSEFNETIKFNNPQLFKEYYSSNDRSILNVKLQLVKDFTRHEAKNIWYDWRTQLTKNLSNELKEREEDLRRDKDRILESLQSVQEPYDECKMTFTILKENMENLVRYKAELNKLDKSKVSQLKDDFARVKNELIKLRSEIQLKLQELKDLDAKIAENDKRHLELKEELSKNELLLYKYRKFEDEELQILNLKFKILQSVARLQFVSIEDGTMKFTFDEMLTVTVSTSVPHDLQFHPFKNNFRNKGLYNHGLKILAGSGSVVERFKKFQRSWTKLRDLDFNLYKISLKYPLQVIESDDIVVKINYVNIVENYKLEVWIKIGEETSALVEVVIKRANEELNEEIVSMHLDRDLPKNEILGDSVKVSKLLKS